MFLLLFEVTGCVSALDTRQARQAAEADKGAEGTGLALVRFSAVLGHQEKGETQPAAPQTGERILECDNHRGSGHWHKNGLKDVYEKKRQGREPMPTPLIHFAGSYSFNGKVKVVTEGTSDQEESQIQAAITRYQGEDYFVSMMDDAKPDTEIHFKKVDDGLIYGIKPPNEPLVKWKDGYRATLETITKVFRELLFDVDDRAYAE